MRLRSPAQRERGGGGALTEKAYTSKWIHLQIRREEIQLLREKRLGPSGKGA